MSSQFPLPDSKHWEDPYLKGLLVGIMIGYSLIPIAYMHEFSLSARILASCIIFGVLLALWQLAVWIVDAFRK